MLCNNIMILPWMTDPLALAASATSRLGLVGGVCLVLWSLVGWALAR